MNIWFLLIIFERFQYIMCAPRLRLIVPPAGNCGDTTQLTCITHTNPKLNSPERNWYTKNDRIMRNGMENAQEEKYQETYDNQTVYLTILNTSLKDEDEYKCSLGFESSDFIRLPIECKAASEFVNVTVTRSKNLLIKIERLHPAHVNITVNLTTEQGSILSIDGSSYCKYSTKHKPYQMCEWTSKAPLTAGRYNCSTVVTTITQANAIITPLIIDGEGPLFLSPPNTSYTVSEGHFIHPITCSAKCDPQCEYRWTKVSDNLTLNQDGDVDLTNLETSTEQNYSCASVNTSGKHVDQDNSIYGRIKYGIHSLVFSPQLYNGDLASPTTCYISCHPNCKYSWARTYDNQSMSNDGTLSLGTARRVLEGRYKCSAYSSVNRTILYQKTVDIIVIYQQPYIVLYPTEKSHSIAESDVTRQINCSLICSNYTAELRNCSKHLTKTSDEYLKPENFQTQKASHYNCQSSITDVPVHSNNDLQGTVTAPEDINNDGTSKKWLAGTITMAVMLFFAVALGLVVLIKRNISVLRLPFISTVAKVAKAEQPVASTCQNYQRNSFLVVSDLENIYEDLPEEYEEFTVNGHYNATANDYNESTDDGDSIMDKHSNCKSLNDKDSKEIQNL